ncbi:SDR family oxidoreductase [candidate division KSB1 bacterium]|nr:SDR family oxidoreductase [candidate division KSB1 bacterium]
MLENLFGLKNKTALITGSSQGIGLTLTRGLACAGAHVILNGRNHEKLDKAINALKANGYKISGCPFDVTNENDVSEAISLINKDIGDIDILINNAGTTIRAPLEFYPLSDWRKILDTNLTSAFLVSRAVVKSMIKNKAGKIINICSIQSDLGRPTIAAYAASKGGLKMLTKNMATEWGKHNIQVNGLAPGYFETELTKPLIEDEEFNAWLCNRTPAGRWGDPEELVGAAVFLASKASDYVNGHILFVDGGLMACV